MTTNDNDSETVHSSSKGCVSGRLGAEDALLLDCDSSVNCGSSTIMVTGLEERAVSSSLANPACKKLI
jgi:hypothetical protein